MTVCVFKDVDSKPFKKVLRDFIMIVQYRYLLAITIGDTAYAFILKIKPCTIIIIVFGFIFAYHNSQWLSFLPAWFDDKKSFTDFCNNVKSPFFTQIFLQGKYPGDGSIWLETGRLLSADCAADRRTMKNTDYNVFKIT